MQHQHIPFNTSLIGSVVLKCYSLLKHLLYELCATFEFVIKKLEFGGLCFVVGLGFLIRLRGFSCTPHKLEKSELSNQLS